MKIEAVLEEEFRKIRCCTSVVMRQTRAEAVIGRNRQKNNWCGAYSIDFPQKSLIYSIISLKRAQNHLLEDLLGNHLVVAHLPLRLKLEEEVADLEYLIFEFIY